MRRLQRLRGVVSGRLQQLDQLLGIDHVGGRFWLAPAVVLVGTMTGFFLIGEVTAAPWYVSLPNGIVIALVMSGLTVACMTPAADASPDDPPEGDDSPVLGSPGGPWTVVAHLGPMHPGDRASLLRKAEAAERELAAAATRAE
ncbi:MAG TPA: hypothetical protein VIG86_07665 [Candidatus Dormibacteraeota bacterium]|jgi:hypothetical protein